MFNVPIMSMFTTAPDPRAFGSGQARDIMPAAVEALFLPAEEHEAQVVHAAVVPRAQAAIASTPALPLPSSSAPGAGAARAAVLVDRVEMRRDHNQRRALLPVPGLSAITFWLVRLPTVMFCRCTA